MCAEASAVLRAVAADKGSRTIRGGKICFSGIILMYKANYTFVLSYRFNRKRNYTNTGTRQISYSIYRFIKTVWIISILSLYKYRNMGLTGICFGVNLYLSHHVLYDLMNTCVLASKVIIKSYC
jgi:hypothetical protein